jgi:deoxyribonuclease V
MIACLDAHYRADEAIAAALLFADWTDAAPAREVTVSVSPSAAYEPNNFTNESCLVCRRRWRRCPHNRT